MIKRPALFLVCVLGFQAQAGELISTGVGVIRKQVVTSREVQSLNLLEIADYDPKPKGKLKLMGIDSKAFAKAVQDSLLESVIAQEAQSFSVMPVTPEDLRMWFLTTGGASIQRPALEGAETTSNFAVVALAPVSGH